MNRILHKLEKELKEREEKYNDNITFIDIFVISLSAGIIILKMLNDSQIYFYSNYAYTSLLASIIMCMLMCHLAIKNIKFTRWYYFAISILIITLNFWIIPKILQYTVVRKKVICLNAILQNKYWHRYGDAGHIKFQFRNFSNVPNQLLHFNSLATLSKYDYDVLPEEGSEIKVCGDISDIGYTYTHIETIGK